MSARVQADRFVARAVLVAAAWDRLADGPRTALTADQINAVHQALRRVGDELRSELEDRVRQASNFDLPEDGEP